MNKHWSDVFGNGMSAKEVMREAENSNITVPDWLHTAYIDLYGRTDEQIDFDKLAQQVEDESKTE